MTPLSTMSHVEIPDFAGLPVRTEGCWRRLRVGSGTALAWVIVDCPAPGQIAAWPSRQAADAGEIHRAVIYTAEEFAGVIVAPVKATEDEVHSHG
jgi:hypothetical protein